MSQKRYRRFFGNKVQARVKRRGKSSPLAKQFARHEKPHAVQDKTEEGQPARLILGYRRITANENSSDSWRNPEETNDHPQQFASKVPGQNSAYRHRNMEGAFGNEGALRFYQATDGRRLDFLRKSGRTFSTNASAVMPCFLRKIGTAPCSMN